MWGYDTTTYGCGCKKESGLRIGENKEYNVNYPCGNCQEKMIGERVKVVRFGDIPDGGKSYNTREGKYEIGVSCYLPTMRPRPEFIDREKIEFTAVVIGWGGDDEPCIDASTIVY